MENQKVIKTLFSVNAASIIEDTENEDEGEASVGYNYSLDTSLPELAYALAGFLKAVENDAEIRETLAEDRSVGEAFINLLHTYYTNIE